MSVGFQEETEREGAERKSMRSVRRLEGVTSHILISFAVVEKKRGTTARRECVCVCPLLVSANRKETIARL